MNSQSSGNDHCAVCESPNYRSLFDIPPRKIVECSDCDHEYVHPLPDPKCVPRYVYPPHEKDSLGTKIDLAYLTKILERYAAPRGKIMDLGCGRGRLEEGLIELGWVPQNIYLMDSSEKDLELAREKYPRSIFICGDAQESMGFRDYFDGILMVEFLEHVHYPKQTLQNALNALKPGGLLIMRGMPNNQSLEAYLGQERWKMRQFIHHYHFFNHSTFSALAHNFLDAEILEFGTFLQKGYRFYTIPRVARNIGVIKKTTGDQHLTYEGNVVETSELGELVLAKMKSVNLDAYKHRDLFPTYLSVLSPTNLEDFFDTISFNPFMSPDFSVVMRKK